MSSRNDSLQLQKLCKCVVLNCIIKRIKVLWEGGWRGRGGGGVGGGEKVREVGRRGEGEQAM